MQKYIINILFINFHLEIKLYLVLNTFFDVYKQKQRIILQIIIFNAVTIYWYCNMPFSFEDKILMKNVYQLKYSFKGYWRNFWK